jgi:hypothetical protein
VVRVANGTNGKSWQYVCYLKNTRVIELPTAALLAALGHADHIFPTGFSRVPHAWLEGAISAHGSLQSFLAEMARVTPGPGAEGTSNREQTETRSASTIPDEEIERRASSAVTESATRVTLETYRRRDQYVAEFPRRRAKGLCDLCDRGAPFLDRNGEPFLEAHHIE